MIAGIVLAAGRSRRMGEPKAFLTLGGRTFLDIAVDALRRGGCAPVVVVAPPGGDPLGDRVAAEAARLGAVVAVNPAADSEQVASLRLGLRALDARADAAMVAPVDVPGITPELVRRLGETFRATGAPVVVPAREGRHGHPVLFARAAFRALLHGDLPEGARSVVRAYGQVLAEVPVEALPPDVDTPADYRRAVSEP